MSTAGIVLFASGGGRSLENLQEQILAGRLDARILRVVVSRPDAGAVARAEGLGLPCTVIGRGTHPDRADRDRAILAVLGELQPDWIVLAGWLLLFPIPPEWEGKVINIHPALLPAYGGKGFYGDRVHEAVLRDRPPLSGCTVHFASAEYDRGPVILQEAVPVEDADDAHALADRVFEAEKRALPEALRLLAGGRAGWRNGAVYWE